MTRMVVSAPVSELLEKDSCSAPRFDLGSSEPRRPGQYVIISEVHNIARGLKGRISRNSTDLLPQFQALLPPRLRSVLYRGSCGFGTRGRLELDVVDWLVVMMNLGPAPTTPHQARGQG